MGGRECRLPLPRSHAAPQACPLPTQPPLARPLQVTLVALLGFLAFSLAERCGLSGILAVFICGATMSHYTWHSLSPSAKVITGAPCLPACQERGGLPRMGCVQAAFRSAHPHPARLLPPAHLPALGAQSTCSESSHSLPSCSSSSTPACRCGACRAGAPSWERWAGGRGGRLPGGRGCARPGAAGLTQSSQLLVLLSAKLPPPLAPLPGRAR